MALNTNTTINTASTAAFNKDYYFKRLLETAKTRLTYAAYGQKKTVPANSGKHVEFRRYELFEPDATTLKLEEGVTPNGQSLKQTTVEADLEQYGAYVTSSDMLIMTTIDNVQRDASELLGDQMGRLIDWVTRDAMIEGASMQFVGGGAGEDAIAAGNVMTIAEIRKAVRTLKKNKARMFTDGRAPHFICICDPDVVFDLQSDEKWEAVRQYQDKEAIYSGEMGRMYGVVFVESTEGAVEKNGSSVDVHHTLVFGADSYGVIDIGGSGTIKYITKQLGSGGTEDPLDQRATVGAKVMAYAAKVLNPAWIIDIMSAATA